eukprot:TRINITY_DN6206_c0_g1_i1.p1 TRINITY_DN6206_c0_g1~~TRINITY_DN6206_c0_g1_i1.p1  ORF type:complete len:284 (+),score=46.93 TRINITY_DN6206_c0_g1_i1:95-853(+)
MVDREPMQEVPLDDPAANDDGFAFVDVNEEVDMDTLTPVQVDGTISDGKKPGQAGAGSMGAAGRFLNDRGYGWMFELDDEDDDAQTPLLEELDIDLTDIGYKLRCVLLPLPSTDRKKLKDEPDFWGPLLVVVLYALVSLYGQFQVVSWIITIWMTGSLLLFLLGRVLGGDTNFSQTLGIVGYSLLPLIIMGLIVPLAPEGALSTSVKALGVLWATYSAGSLLATEGLESRKALLFYPILLLYVYFVSLYSGA